MWRRSVLGLVVAWAVIWGAPVAAETLPGGPVPLPRPAVATGLPEPAAVTPDAAPARSPRPIARDPWLRPALRWDDHPEADTWTQASLAALRRSSAQLASAMPADIAEWCPGYTQNAPPGQRRAFWLGLVSALAWYESGHRPQAVGGGRWFGLMQIAPATARARGCAAGTGDALLDGRANLACAMRIIGQNVARDGVVAAGRGGVAAEWAPFRSSRKRESMRDWVRAQAYCQPVRRPPPGLRPLPRPVRG